VDDYDSAPPEVTIEPADNGFVVRHQQRGSKKDEPSRTVRRVASSADEALDHARTAISGGSKSFKKRSVKRDGQSGVMSDAEGESGSASSPAAHAAAAHAARAPRRGSARRRRPRIGGRR
jgi:hypothetical protein